MHQKTDGLIELPDAATATYCVVLDHLGEMYCGIGDMDILNRIQPDNVITFFYLKQTFDAVLIDFSVHSTPEGSSHRLH